MAGARGAAELEKFSRRDVLHNTEAPGKDEQAEHLSELCPCFNTSCECLICIVRFSNLTFPLPELTTDQRARHAGILHKSMDQMSPFCRRPSVAHHGCQGQCLGECEGWGCFPMGMWWLGHTASEDKLQSSFLCKALKQCKPKAAGAASHLLCHLYLR